MLKASSLPCRNTVDFLNDSETIDQLAKASGFLSRKPRKVTPSAFIKAVVLAGANDSVSFKSIAWQAAQLDGEPCSRQNLHRRCDKEAAH